MSNEVAPFGGVQASGLGREGAKYGLEEYLDQIPQPRPSSRLLKKDFERATQRKSFSIQLISARKWGVFGKF
ncbi:hypothetical protein KF941_25195 [Paracoccus sp. pheM1]|nr:hypothetical protein [Paracoccus sp. pheM1]